MSGKRGYLENMAVMQISTVGSIPLLCMVVSTRALSQTHDDAEGQDLTASVENYQRFEAERRRQQQLQLENVRLQQEKLRFENERLRQENERREQERLRLENERLRQENERHEFEQLRRENEARERQRAQTTALPEQTERTGQSNGPDIYEQLRTLGQLKDDGILTEGEFQRLKKKILD
ncbi:MAG: SHOCT domain-containing protein [Gammaproteobacteria bacterium]|nr:SHOCT domain-containing protein [Gammaproteobacteria bacterium]